MKKYISILLITLVVAGSSCRKTYLSELATNPNTPANTTPNLSLSGALKITAGFVNGSGYTMYACWMGYMSWSTGYQPNLALEAFSITTSTYDDFSNIYLNISNYSALLNSTPEPYYQAIAKIMIAYDYENLVDNYNNVPYSQAILGASNLAPAYDSGSTIYDNLLVQLDAAIALIQKAPSSALNPGTSDIMYGGTMSKWLAFANTLKLRLAVRQSTSASLATKKAALITDLQSTSALGYISTSSEGNVNPGYTNLDANGGEQAPLALNFGYKQSGSAQTNNGEYQANTYSINFFTNNNDPRLTAIYAPSTSAAANGAVVGTPFGITVPPTLGGKTVAPSKYSAFLLSPTKAAVLFSASQSLFLQAEAQADGLLPGGAAAAAISYNAGISASFTEFGLTAAQATTYEAQASVAFPTTGTFAAQQQAIITQKWAALNPYDPFEAYNEFRRTGYPAVPVSVYSGNTSPTTPTRIPYPYAEYSTNANSVGAQGTINIFTSKIFWAQ